MTVASKTGAANTVMASSGKSVEGGILHLNPRIPLVTLVLPVAAGAAADTVQALDDGEKHQVLGLLVAELAFDAQAQRGAVLDRQRFVFERVSEDGLRMGGLGQI